MALLQELRENVQKCRKKEMDLDDERTESSIKEITSGMRKMSEEGKTSMLWQTPYSRTVMFGVASHFSSLGIKATAVTDDGYIVSYSFDWS